MNQLWKIPIIVFINIPILGVLKTLLVVGLWADVLYDNIDPYLPKWDRK